MVEIRRIRDTRFKPHFHQFKWRSTATIHRTIGCPLRCHVIARIGRSIATQLDGSDQATSPARYKIFEKLNFN